MGDTSHRLPSPRALLILAGCLYYAVAQVPVFIDTENSTGGSPFPSPRQPTTQLDVPKGDRRSLPVDPRIRTSGKDFSEVTRDQVRYTVPGGIKLESRTPSPDVVLATVTHRSALQQTNYSFTAKKQRNLGIDIVTNTNPELKSFTNVGQLHSQDNQRGSPTQNMARLPSDEEHLLSLLFSPMYNPSARPVMSSSKSVPVEIQFSLMHIKDLDVRSQIFTTTGLLILEWTDERLTWKPEEQNNITEIIVEARSLWRPEFAVINGAEKIYEDYNQFRAVIKSDGVIHWEPGGVFKTMCEIDITYYPFDEQTCELSFGAWSYHTSKMNLTNSSANVNKDSYKSNGEWDIYHTEVVRKEFSYECCPDERFANVVFILYLRRRHTFYIMNVILPSIMTSVLLLSIFHCTPAQKVQIGVVVLLSFRIFLLNVSGNIPKTSDHIPLLGIYLTCTMAITTLSMVLTVFVLNLHHITDRPVPNWARRLVFVYLARTMGMCSYASEPSAKSRKRATTIPNSASFFRRSSVVIDPEADEKTAIIELHHRGTNGGSGAPRDGPNPGRCYENTYSFTKYAKEEEKTEEFGKDWKRMAEVFDRLFFWLFLLAILISTLVLFHPLTKARALKEEPK